MGIKFSDLEKRAERSVAKKNRKPYVIEVEDDDPIVIPYPDAIKSMEYERREDLYGSLQILAGAEFPRILQLVEGKDLEVVQYLLTDMWKFWRDDAHEVPGGKRGLRELFDEYGLEILRDFRSYWFGLDVLEYFRGERTWAEFYDFLNGLPAHSRFKAKLALDPDFAEILHQRKLELNEDDDEEDDDSEEGWKPTTRSQEGYTPMIASTYTLIESVQEVTRTLIAVNGQKPPSKQKLPRPVSSLDVLELMDEKSEMDDLAARFRVGQRD
ncbi:tail assembly chaperone [Gordonia phage Outis]|nr:tail assembly chaperone [Gordonia phage StarStruck]WKW85012.1 tail assembly chaperone [Gordonia phage Outis]